MDLTPFLEDHLCWPKDGPITLDTPHVVFKLRPGLHGDRSIRFRVRQAARLVKEAADAGLVDQDLRHLLVINAGAAGLAAAMTAEDLGIAALLRSSSPVGTPLMGCESRHVDPGIYLWPRGDHWRRNSVPHFEETDSGFRPEPLTWSAGSADAIARDWFDQYMELWMNALKFRDEVAADSVPAAQKWWADYVRLLDCQPTQRVILVTGIEQENTSMRVNYTGPGFWQNDTLWHWSSGRRSDSALVSGSGDGALQDYLRLTCGNRPAREIYETIFQLGEPGRTTGPTAGVRVEAEGFVRKVSRTIGTIRDLIARGEPLSQVPEAVGSVFRQVQASLIAFAEEVALGVPSWWDVPPGLLEPWSVLSDDELFPVADATHGLSKKDEIEDLRERVHAEFTKIIRSLVEDEPVWQAICEAIRESGLISEAIRQRVDGRRVALVNHSGSFTICYPMNHCLSLLISEYIERELQLPTLFHHLELAQVTPDDDSEHVCCGDAVDCAASVHRASFVPRSGPADGQHELARGRYGPVVIRYGLVRQEPSSRVRADVPVPA